MSDLLWQKPGVAVDEKIQAFLAGDDVVLDREFFLHDIAASKAHAEGLQHIGILSVEELAELLRELDVLAEDYRAGALVAERGQAPELRLQPEPRRDQHLVVAAAAGMHLAPGVAEALGQAELDRRMAVLVAVV